MRDDMRYCKSHQIGLILTDAICNFLSRAIKFVSYDIGRDRFHCSFKQAFRYLFVTAHEQPKRLAQVDEAREQAVVGHHGAHIRVSALRQVLKSVREKNVLIETRHPFK
jgi:hypothetical protein